ncbi:MAG: hypothetical protein FWD67_06500 [Betaproteobacteria bacterium]|nr:hypothetical protein [Betaproteobacteria bacterium]
MAKDYFGRKTWFGACLLQTVALALVLWAGAALAASAIRDSEIPESLKPWKGWALYGQEAWLCPEVEGEHDRVFCAWPGELKLKLEIAHNGGGLSFSQNWELQYESAVPLPGSREYWPQQVTVNGKVHPVLMNDDVPVVWLEKGRHTISGWIPWQEQPQTIEIPENVALVSLVAYDKPILPLERHGKALTLGTQGGTAMRVEDSLDVQVVRKLADGIPARLTTRLRFKVSGKAREWSMPNILPAHFVPVRIASPWAARLDADGRLQVQVMPGQAMIEIEARLNSPLESIEPVFSPERPQEVWSYEAAPSLRTTVVSPDKNMLSVDPRQAGVSTDWLPLPAFVVNSGARFQIEERSRGQNEREGQRLTLKRNMWLDFSGKGFFAQDHIEGTMQQGWRFDVAAPYRLERADSLVAPIQRSASNDLSAANLSAALLVTYGANEALTGVEWHQMNVTLNAGVRLAANASDRVPVTGWQQPFDSVDAVLHIPYGYQLIAAPGADNTSKNVWVERWTILDIFLAAFFALLAWRLFGMTGGAVAVVYLALAMHELAPVQSFAAVVILALLSRALPEGRLRKVSLIGERIALLCFIGMAVVFIPMQIRTALYPQLEEDTAVFALSDAKEAPVSNIDKESFAPLSAPLTSASNLSEKALQSDSSPWSKYAPETRQRYAQSTVTQTGSGEPAWKLGHHYRLHWSGPVTELDSVRLLISPPWLTRLLRLLMVALLGWLIWRSIRVVFPGAGIPTPWRGATKALPSSAAVALSVLCLTGFVAVGWGFSTPAAAATPKSGAFPPNSLLKELKTRLLKAPDCSPLCVDIAKTRIDADASQLKVALVAHVEAVTSLALPEPGERMTLLGVRVNGETRSVLRIREKNYIVLQRGIHDIRFEYALSGDSASLGFPVRPAQIEFGSAHWQVDGIDEGHLLGETLNFSRIVTAASALPIGRKGGGGDAAAVFSSPTQQFPPFVHVQRDLVFDLDWSVRTQVTRIAPEEGGFTFPVPLLPGEYITTPELKVQDGHALAAFSTKANSVNWTSRLDNVKNVVELNAPPLTEHAETWRVTVNPAWHLEWNGVPMTLSSGGTDVKTELAWRNSPSTVPVSLPSAGEDVIFEFHPLPGEKLVLTLTQPAKVDGGIRAIDRVRLENYIGQHASDIRLEFNLRASQGGEHLVTLPPELEVLKVQRDGVPLNLQPRENHLSLPVSPGAQTYTIQLRHQGEIGFSMSSPNIDLNLPAANIDLRTVIGEQRWILAASGPTVGPAVLYWGELLVALLLAFLLAKSGISSLKRWQWFLLVLGFSTFSWVTLFIITLWLLAIDWRVRNESCSGWSTRRFNTMQVGIVVLTIVMLIGLINTVPGGLLGVPDMGIRGYGSSGNDLGWFADRSDSLLPIATVFSLPIWLYRALMLAWTLWLANILIRWLSRGLSAWLKNGYWKKIVRSRKNKTIPPPIAPGAATDGEKRN